jgi:hypothetical protein
LSLRTVGSRLTSGALTGEQSMWRSSLDHAIEVDMVTTIGNVRRDGVGRGWWGEG